MLYVARYDGEEATGGDLRVPLDDRVSDPRVGQENADGDEEGRRGRPSLVYGRVSSVGGDVRVVVAQLSVWARLPGCGAGR